MPGLWYCANIPLCTVIKSRAMTLSRSPQCRALSRALMDEKSLPPLFPVGGGGDSGYKWLVHYKCNWGDIITDNDTMNRHKSECILIKVFLCNNVFTTHVKTIIFSREGEIWHLCEGLNGTSRLFHLFGAKPNIMLDQIGTSLVRFPEL